MSTYEKGVFINAPFDRKYKRLFDALVFAVHDCGFIARCSMEEGDSSNVRVQTIARIIDGCRFGIHDLSRTTLDSKHRLPRFNMPLELGIFLGAKRYVNAKQRRKSCLVLERDPYRYQIFCSDIGGQDIWPHGNKVEDVIAGVRDWLRTVRNGSARGDQLLISATMSQRPPTFFQTFTKLPLPFTGLPFGPSMVWLYVP